MTGVDRISYLLRVECFARVIALGAGRIRGARSAGLFLIWHGN